MRKLSLCFLLFFSAASQAQFTDTKPKVIDVPENCDPVANHYMVKTPKNISIPHSPNTLSVSDFANDLIANYGGDIDAVFADTNSTFGGFSIKNLSLSSAENMLKNENNVLSLEQVCYITAASSQSNPGWALDRLDQTNIPLDQSFDVPNYTSNSTHIYVIDQAIRSYLPGTNQNFLHQDLANVKSPGRFPGDHVHFGAGIPGGIDRNSLPCTIHGTAVAGNIAGTRTGIARNSVLHSYAAFDCQSPAMTDTAIITQAFRRVLAEHPENYPNERAVINFSATSASSTALVQAIKDLAVQNIITVVAMGNDSQNQCSGIPQLDETIAVGASGSSSLSGNTPSTIDTRWVESNTSGSNYGTCTDIYAPGSNVATTAAASPTSISTESGTSFAAPLVTGAVAVYLEQNPNASLSSVVSAIKSNALVDKITNVPVGDNDLLNICFLNGSCDPSNPGPASITSANTDSACVNDFGIRLFGSNLTQDHRIGVNFNPFTPAARVPSGQIVSNTQGTISWCIPHTTQVDQQLRWDMSTTGIDVYLSNPTGTVIDGPVTVLRARPNSGAIEAPARIEYPTSANGGPDIQITRSTDARVTRYEYFAANSSSVTQNDNLLASYTISPNDVSSYLFIFELDGEAGPFDPGPSGSNDRLPSGTWYLGVRACDNANNCSAITVGSNSITQ